MRLPTRDLLRMLWRSFYLPALWTVQRGQNLGYAYSLWPVFRRLYPRRDDRRRALRPHTTFFSTHPYMAGVILGVVAGMEEKRAGAGVNGEPSVEAVIAARGAMAGPLAALGEAFFWNTWLPVSLAATLAAVAARPGLLPWAPVIFLGLFNAMHLGVRVLGLFFGYRWTSGVVTHLAALRVQKVLPYLAALGAALVLSAATLSPVAGGPATGLAWTVIFLGLLRLGVRPAVLALATAGASIAYAAVSGG